MPENHDRAVAMNMTESTAFGMPTLRAWIHEACRWLAANLPALSFVGSRGAPAPTRADTGPAIRITVARVRTGMGRAIAASVCLLAGGCTTLLPSSRTEVVSDWDSYDDAVTSLATVEPYTSTRQSVHAQGLDPSRNPAITVLNFSDVLQRFAAATLIKPEDVDRGIRACLQAGKQCGGYAIAVEKLHRHRTGSFWLDSLNFRRETVTTGWRADVLLVFVDEALVYKLVGGRPTINEVDLRRNPLGPLQGFGDLSLQLIR
jgi:hypothetical protein